MELLDGRSLDSELREARRVSLARASDLLAQACSGLAAAHAAGVIHRDVKPENIFIHREGNREIVKVLDFGIAKVTGSMLAGAPAMTGSGALLGTPHYMAPERFLGQECTPAADAYSIGIVLYRALTGDLPYEGTLAEVLMQAVARSPPDARRLAPEVPAHVAELIRRALDHNPGARPSVSEIGEVLRAIAPRKTSVPAA
jgi:serine/threonine protein kinase